MYACTFLVISMQLRTSAHDSRPPSPTPELHILSLLLLLLSVESLPLAPTLPPTTTSSPTPVYSGSDPLLLSVASLPYLWLQHNLRSDSGLLWVRPQPLHLPD